MTSFDADRHRRRPQRPGLRGHARARAAARCWCSKPLARLGGAARTEEFAPGFRVSSVAHLLNRLHPEVVKALELRKARPVTCRPQRRCRRLRCRRTDDPLMLPGAYGESARRRRVRAEQAAWKELRAQLFRYAGILKPFLSRRPPDLARHVAWRDAGARPDGAGAEAARQGRHARLPARAPDERRRPARRAAHRRPAEGPARLRRGARQPSRPALADLAARPLLPPGRRDRRRARRADRCRRAAWARSSRRSPPPRQRPASPSAPTRRWAKSWSRKAAPSASCLQTARRSARRTIVSAINPRTTFLDLVGPRELDTGFVRKVKNIRMKGDAAKLHLALDRPPRISRRRRRRPCAAGWSSRPRPTMSSAPSTRRNMASSRPSR